MNEKERKEWEEKARLSRVHERNAYIVAIVMWLGFMSAVYYSYKYLTVGKEAFVPAWALKELDKCELDSDRYYHALQEANDEIEDAKSYAWESYEDMGTTLDNLTPVRP